MAPLAGVNIVARISSAEQMQLNRRQQFAVKLAAGFLGGLAAGTLAEATGLLLHGLTDPMGNYIGWATLAGTFVFALLAPEPRDSVFAVLLACCVLSFSVPLAVNSPHAPTVIYELWFGHVGMLARGAGYPLAFVFLVLAIIATKRVA